LRVRKETTSADADINTKEQQEQQEQQTNKQQNKGDDTQQHAPVCDRCSVHTLCVRTETTSADADRSASSKRMSAQASCKDNRYTIVNKYINVSVCVK
jgi:hypothetical protein